MPTTQLPFFLNSARSCVLSPLGNAFDVKLDSPQKIPADARDTRIFVQSASAVYSFPNVTASNNKIELFYQSSGPLTTHDGQDADLAGFILAVTPGLYATLGELQHGIADAAIAARVHKANPGQPVATREDFTANYLEIRENLALSRVELVIKDQHLQITLDRQGGGQDLFAKVLGFATTQTLHSPAAEYSVTLNESDASRYMYYMYSSAEGTSLFLLEWQRAGQSWDQARAANPHATCILLVPNWVYTQKSFMNALNAWTAFDRYSQLSGDNVASISIGNLVVNDGVDGPADATVTLIASGAVSSGAAITKLRFPGSIGTDTSDIQSSATPALPTAEFVVNGSTRWVDLANTPAQLVVQAVNAASIDNIHALQISALGLAAGVHVNGKSGSATLCRFPINTSPGGVIQFEPINPHCRFDRKTFVLDIPGPSNSEA